MFSSQDFFRPLHPPRSPLLPPIQEEGGSPPPEAPHALQEAARSWWRWRMIMKSRISSHGTLMAGLSALTLGALVAALLFVPACEKETSSAPSGDCRVTLLSPNGGEAWTAGDSADIAWNSEESCGDYLRIDLLQEDQACAVIGDSVANDGSYRWRVAECSKGTGSYKVSILDLASQASDASDSSFTITTPAEACSLTVTAPNGGESLTSGDSVAVTWQFRGDCARSLLIELLRDGVACDTLSETAANDGSFDWAAAQCGSETGGYRIQLTDPISGVQDQSDGDFSILPAQTPCTLTVTYPNGGESLTVGDAVTIGWDASGSCGGTVLIELLNTGQPCDTLAEAAPNDGSFAWTAAQCGGAAAEYAIRITDAASGASDQSDAGFGIAPLETCALEVTAPLSGSVFCEGDDVALDWESNGSGCGSTVLIELLYQGAVCDTLVASAPNDGSHSWPATSCGALGDGYALRVTDTDSGAHDTSPGSFTITSGCEIVIEAPQGGTSFCAGDPVEIEWSAAPCCGPAVTIQLLQGGEACETIASETLNDGNHTWTAETCAGAGSDYSLRILDPSTGATRDLDGALTILSCDCEIEVDYPDGGELLQIGDAVTLQWQSSDSCGAQVAIELLQDGASCATIAAAAPNTGSYDWTAAQCGGDSSDYAIRVQDLDSGAQDESDGPFFITEAPPECVIGLSIPNDGESYCVGETVPITWDSEDACGEFVRIDLYLDQVLCLPIAASTANDGYHEWTATQCDLEEQGYTIRVTDLTSGYFDQGDGDFSILPPCRVTVLGPDGGESYCAGEEVSLSWSATDCCGDSVKIELRRSGASCLTIAETTPNDGSFSWTAEQCSGESFGYRVRIQDLTSGQHDDSNGTFAIRPACALALTHPGGGEQFCQGALVPVTWNAGDCCGSHVSLELLREGVVCHEIASETPNSGSFDWTPAQCDGQAAGYSLRVTDLDSQASSQSGTFEILPECTLELLSPNGGETLCLDALLEISWQPSDCCGDSVGLELLEGGTACLTISAGTPNDGDFVWTVEACGDPGEAFQIRVTDLGSQLFDDSDADFAIAEACSLELLYPLGDELLHAGQAVDLSWTASDCCGENVTLELLQGGTVCHEIAGLTANDGGYTWTAAQCGVAMDDYTVRIRDATGSASFESGAFWILPEDALLVCESNLYDYQTIQEGIDNVPEEGTVFLCDGTYTGAGNVDLDFGGKALTLRSLSGDAEACIIDCEDNARAFYFNSSEDTDTVIEGITVTRGSSLINGGAVYCGSGTSPRFLDCKFTESAADYGGAVYAGSDAHPRFTGCVFENNEVDQYGGAIYCSYATARLIECSFTGNQCTGSGWGGAVYFCYSPVTFEITDCSFTDNSAGYGGAIGNQDPDVPLQISGCSFEGNAALGAGAVYINGDGGSISDCTFDENSALQAGAMIIDSPGATFQVSGCDFTGNWSTSLLLLRQAHPEIQASPSPLGGDRHMADRYCGAVEIWYCDADFDDCSFSGNSAELGGGAAVTWGSGTATFSSCIFAENEAFQGAALYSRDSDFALSLCEFNSNAADSSGGAIHAQATTAPTIDASSFADNSVTLPMMSVGGAIYCVDNTAAQIQNTSFGGNQSAFVGGALCCEDDSNCDLIDCDFSGNSAYLGGAVASQACIPNLEDCTFTGNAADVAAGAYYCLEILSPPTILRGSFDENEAPQGGAIHVDGNIIVTLLTITDSDFSNNSGTTGGAISCGQAELTLDGCTFTGNSAAEPSLPLLRQPPTEPTAWLADLPGPRGDRAEDYYGGAIYSEGELTVSDCAFSSNQAQRGAGVALYDLSADGHFYDCDFTSNSAARGGGLYCYGGIFDADSCAFGANLADSSGAGIHCELTSGTPQIDDCSFDGNAADSDGGRGGGLCCWDEAAPDIDESFFDGNSAYQGGGLYCYDSSPTLSGCDFTNNEASNHGGAVACWSSSLASFASCDFGYNEAASMGGAIFSSLHCDVAINGCTFGYNTAATGGALRLVYQSDFQITASCFHDNSAGYGGALSADENCAPVLTSVTIFRNAATTDGAGISAHDGSSVTLENSILSHSTSGAATYCVGGGTVTATCCDVYGNDGGDWTACLSGQLGGDNISQDPLYCDPDELQLNLQVGSPCDAGCGLMGAYSVGCLK
ncbi:MAG: hypothetical protein GF330_14630 [Candidatus Eisenbacteria bacterium]|nr:hypothetical protein [Candidatus Eisenbacteria bacterium]